MKAIKSNGLIPVRLTRSALPYRKGDVHGFNPVLVGRMLSADPPECEVVDIPADIETIDVEVLVTVPKSAPEPVAEPDPVAEITIPDNWETMNVLKLIKLAKKLDATIETEEAARAAVHAELERRTAPLT